MCAATTSVSSKAEATIAVAGGRASALDLNHRVRRTAGMLALQGTLLAVQVVVLPWWPTVRISRRGF